MDVSTVNWDDYVWHYCKGVKVYLLKEKMDDLRKTKRILDRYGDLVACLCWMRLFGKISSF